tara:strand:+ start:59 stop:487 length:429 start_codon:yes stop_codon:yes gene_type:complete
MKFENNWKHKNLENLEKSIWGEPEFDSNLVITCHKLRKKQLIDFTVEDLRIMIGQNFSLDYLIPIAIEKLEENILFEGNLFEGDLLKMILTSDKEYWKKENSNWKIICELFKENSNKIEDYCYQNDCKNQWLNDFEKFRKVN